MSSRRKFTTLRLEELEARWVPSAVASTNWSGYAVQAAANSVTAVSGSWVVPTAGTTTSGYSSVWVGIDGFNSSTVEQIGTETDFVNGKAQYYAWYEMYPTGSVELKMAINPGDKISASVNYASNGYTLTITDTTKSETFTTTQKGHGAAVVGGVGRRGSLLQLRRPSPGQFRLREFHERAGHHQRNLRLDHHRMGLPGDGDIVFGPSAILP